MSCEHLICAHCAGPVVEGRCTTCRAARAEIHHHHGLQPQQIMILALLVLMLIVTLALQNS
jgi:hypothetical protein